MRKARLPPEWNVQEKCLKFGEEYELNGREIRNLVQVSVSICQRRNQPLSETVIEDIYDLRYRRKGHEVEQKS
jgi:hypothetical protein